MEIFFVLWHWLRKHYYGIALDHIHPTNPDMLLISQRYIHSRNIVARYLGSRNAH